MRKVYAVITAICLTALVSCFSPWEGGSGTIAIAFSDSDGSGISRAGFTPFSQPMTFQIRLTGPGGIELIETVLLPEDNQSVRIAVTPGNWNVSVRLFDDNGVLTDIGFSNDPVTVRAGQFAETTVTRYPAATANSAAALSGLLAINPPQYILITGDITVDNFLFISSAITLIADSAVEINRELGFTEQIFSIGGGNDTLTLGRPGMSGAITINGTGVAERPLITVGGTLVMYDRVTLTGNDNTYASSGGGGVLV